MGFAVTFVLVFLSGNPLVGNLDKTLLWLFVALLFGVVHLIKGRRLTKNDMVPMVLFAAIMVIHIIEFGSVVLLASIGFALKLLTAFFTAKSVDKFRIKYIEVMYLLSLVSFPFYVASAFSVQLSFVPAIAYESTIGSIEYHAFFYNLRESTESGYARNMGMFWEPGAFAGYLIVAIFFLMLETNDSTKGMKRRYSIVLYLALFSTFSTMGFLTISILLLYQLRRFSKDFESPILRALRIFLPLVFVAAVFSMAYFYNSSSFLGEKVKSQFAVASDYSEESNITRFGNVLYDFSWISQRPLLGWSATPETRSRISADVEDLVQRQGVGLTGFAVKFGVVGFFTYFFFLYRRFAFETTSKPVSMLAVVLIASTLIGEQFLNFPLYLSLIFINKNSELRI